MTSTCTSIGIMEVSGVVVSLRLMVSHWFKGINAEAAEKGNAESAEKSRQSFLHGYDMLMMPKPTKKTKLHDSYLELVLRFPLASIRDDDHLAEAQSVIDEVSANPELDAGQTMYLDALCDLVACYEDEHHPIEPASDADMLKHLLEAKGVTQQQVSQATAIPKSSISEVLSGKKQFTKQMIRKLAQYFQIDASVLTSNW